MKNSFVFAFLFLFLLSINAATIKGTVYLPDLLEANNSILTINTTPEQTIVLKNAKYEIKVPTGTYNISVIYFSEGLVLYSAEIVEIIDNGTYNIDHILLPYVEVDDINNYSEFEYEFVFDEQEKTNPVQIFGFDVNLIQDILIILIAFFVIVYLMRKRKFKRVNYQQLPKDLRILIDLLKAREGRATQKELREELKWSEAKLSLAIAELEHIDHVKKIKKGRGNIIILKNIEEE